MANLPAAGTILTGLDGVCSIGLTFPVRITASRTNNHSNSVIQESNPTCNIVPKSPKYNYLEFLMTRTQNIS